MKNTKKRIVLAQISPILGDLQSNVKVHKKIILEARENNAELIVFPELSLVGYQLKDLVSEVAISTISLLELWTDLGVGRSIEFVVGYAECSTGFRFYNAFAHLRLCEDGQVKLLHNHRKLNPPTYGMFEEERFFSTGKSLTAYDSVLLGRSGMLICEDIWHPANTLLLSIDGNGLEGVKIIIVGASSPARGVGEGKDEPHNADVWKLIARFTAIACNCFVLVSHRVGVEDGFVFVGGSEIIAPGGESLAKAALFDEEILTCDIRLEALIRERRVSAPGGAFDDYELLMRELERIKRENLSGGVK